jgi:cystathionine beta-lyase
MFGTGGRGFQRLNLACPRATLAEALERMARALS